MVTSNLGNSITNDKGSVSFNCPKCAKSKVIRTKNERQNVARYTCKDCGFEGPN